MRVRIVLAGLLAVAGFISPACADDFFGPQPGNAVARAWQGFYVGGKVGYTLGNYSATVTPGPAAVDIDASGFDAGLFGGYNRQWSRFVAGVEADVTFAIPGGSQVIAPNTYSADGSWTGEVRGRFGYTFDQFLIYATAGVAFGDIEYASPTNGASDAVKFGGVLGLGVEAFVTNNIIARAEYVYTSFGSGSYALGPLTVDGDASSHSLHLGLGYHF